ncbi:MAG TPA: MBL fold metallo-hydrolase, partial [Thermoanaerobaculia bacterium]
MDKDLFTLTTDHFTIEGRSRAGHETWFRIRDLGVMLDLGRGADAAVGISNVFVTHAHLDHAAGIAFYAGQRHLHRMSGGRVWVPAESADGFREMMRVWERLTNSRFEEVEILGMAAGDVVRLGRAHEVRAHAATHRVAANAYEVIEIRHRLKEEGLSQEEIHRRRADVIEEYLAPLLFYTGDTDRGILESCEALFRAEVLMIECSFIVDGHQERAAKYRHIHFDDIADFAERFQNQLVVLTHF